MQHFMITHDQNLLSSTMVNMFVGNGKIDTDTSEDLNTLLVCSDLPFNLEQYPSLCSFTAWYAISKNKLCRKKDKICLVEYDVELSEDFYKYQEEIVSPCIDDHSIIAYSYTSIDHYVFYKSTPWLEISLKKVYNIDLMDFMEEVKGKHLLWPTTTNIALNSKVLDDFVNWFLPMTELFRHHSLGAYVHERAFFVFCVLNDIVIKYVTKPILLHKQLKSHATLDIYGIILRKYNTTDFSENMRLEYDVYYNNELRRASEETNPQHNQVSATPKKYIIP